VWKDLLLGNCAEGNPPRGGGKLMKLLITIQIYVLQLVIIVRVGRGGMYSNIDTADQYVVK